MKKISFLLALITLLLCVASCGEPSSEPSKNDDKQIKTDGEVVTVFGVSEANNFDIIYPAGDVTVAGDIAGKIYTSVVSAGISAPRTFADNGKSESGAELLVGDTSRAISAEAKALLAEKIEAEPDAKHWVWLYKDGQIAFYANSKEAYVEGISDLTEKYLIDGEIKMSLETKDIGYVAAPIPPRAAYMSYEIPDNFYEGYTDPFGMNPKDYKEMTVTRLTETKYVIEYFITKNTYYSVCFVRKQWGMWMLGAISYIDEGVVHQLCPGSTDYEFVLTCGNETARTFRSGNHANFGNSDAYDPNDSTTANDRMLDMTFYDGKTGEKVVLDKVGDKVTLDGLRIVMHHNIYEQEYAQENVLMNVEKSYLFNGFDILMDAQLYMAQDVSFGSSYSCMFPIMKEYGNCMMLYNMDGTTTYAKTSPVALGGREYDLTDWNHKTTKVELWGERHPEYHMTVEIGNPEQQFMGAASKKSYVGLRDMLGGNQNKVYFTFGTSVITLKHGEELHFVNSWSFEKIEGFENLDREPDVIVKRELE